MDHRKLDKVTNSIILEGLDREHFMYTYMLYKVFCVLNLSCISKINIKRRAQEVMIILLNCLRITIIFYK